MKLMQNPERVAGTLFLISVVPVLLAWIILLLVGHQPDMSVMASALDQVQYMFSAKNPTRLWFVWFALLPLFSAALGAAYSRGGEQSNIRHRNAWGLNSFGSCILRAV